MSAPVPATNRVLVGAPAPARAVALIVAVVMTLVTAALGFGRVAVAQERESAVAVFAAASLKGALDEVVGDWAAQRATRVSLVYAASSAMARQIEEGAPADIFVSADNDWMDHLQRQGLIRVDTRAPMVGNQLVLIAPATDQVALRIEPGFLLAPALRGGRLAVADVRSVPAGRYARAALAHLGVWPTVENRLAMAENVRAALALVARGEAPLGIVYATDALAEPRVRVVAAFPADTHPSIDYPLAVMTRSRQPMATQLAAHLQSPEAARIFARHGFVVGPQ